MQETRASRSERNMPSLCIVHIWLHLYAFWGHLLAAAHQGDATGVLRSWTARAGFFDFQFKSAGIAEIQITFFHVTTICHGETSFGYYSGAIECPSQCFFCFLWRFSQFFQIPSIRIFTLSIRPGYVFHKDSVSTIRLSVVRDAPHIYTIAS